MREPPQLVCFNLGFLPGGDRDIITRPGTSVAAVQAALDIVRPDGLVSVLAYTGHPGADVSAFPYQGWAWTPAPMLHRLVSVLQHSLACIASNGWRFWSLAQKTCKRLPNSVEVHLHSNSETYSKLKRKDGWLYRHSLAPGLHFLASACVG